MKEEQILSVLPEKIKKEIIKNRRVGGRLQEIRLREEKTVFMKVDGVEKELFHVVTREEIREALEYIASYSLYAYERELGQGFLTIQGGHRVGVAGKVVTDHGNIKNFQYISSINIRVCHEILECADKLFPGILKASSPCHTLIVSPPGCGKTTLLRDVIRQLSEGNLYVKGMNVGVVDERSEIGGCYQGVPQNQIGKRTDILDACPKVQGMIMMIRSMSPQILAVDEIGSKEDKEAVDYAMNCGVKVFATAHGESVEEINKKLGIPFERYILLKQGEIGKIEGIYDERGMKICG